MKRAQLYLTVMAVVALIVGDAMTAWADRQGSPSIRPAVVAGRFYPSTSAVLKQSIRAYMGDAMPAIAKNPVAIIAPHAGYIYSGQICADAFNQVLQNTYDTIVILGTNHTSPHFKKISIYDGEGFETPLGIAPIDKGLVSDLLKADKNCVLDTSVHAAEHSIEVQIPFIQTLFPKAKIVPVIIGYPDPELCGRFGQNLARTLTGRRALVVASTDLSHYPSYRDAVKIDGETLQAITKMNAGLLHAKLVRSADQRIENLQTEACGEGAILTVMAAAQGLGAKAAKTVSYANSGDIGIGEPHRVVGYGAVVFAKEISTPPSVKKTAIANATSGTVFSTNDKKALLAFARKNIMWFLNTQTVPLARGFSSAVQQRQGVFVTLKKNRNLRGCIGRIIPDGPLCRLVGTMALQSAFNDNRFSPVTTSEMKDIEIELSVLTPIKGIAKAGDIVVGRDGVILQKGGRSAVFLPQVAPEQGWNREEMLENLSLKAGLPREGWKEGAQFSTFQAIVFSESEFK